MIRYCTNSKMKDHTVPELPQDLAESRASVRSDIAQKWNEGQSASTIAKALKTSRGAVMGQVWRMRRAGVELR